MEEKVRNKYTIGALKRYNQTLKRAISKKTRKLDRLTALAQEGNELYLQLESLNRKLENFDPTFS